MVSDGLSEPGFTGFKDLQDNGVSGSEREFPPIGNVEYWKAREVGKCKAKTNFAAYGQNLEFPPQGNWMTRNNGQLYIASNLYT